MNLVRFYIQILALAEAGGCEPELQADHIKCKKSNKEMQESHDYMAKRLAEKSKEVSDTVVSIFVV